MDVNPSRDPRVDEGIQVLKDVFSVHMRDEFHYSNDYVGTFYITTTFDIIHEILEEYDITMDELKFFLKRLRMSDNLVCRLSSDTESFISKNGRSFKLSYRGGEIITVADTEVIAIGHIKFLTIIVVDGILLQSDQNLAELLILHKQAVPIANTNALHLDSLPYNVIVNMVASGNIEPSQLCLTTRKMRDYCERSFIYEGTLAVVPQYIYYLALNRDGLDVDMIAKRTGLSNKGIYKRYVKIKNAYNKFVRTVQNINNDTNLDVIFYTDVMSLLYFNSRSFDIRYPTMQFFYYKIDRPGPDNPKSVRDLWQNTIPKLERILNTLGAFTDKNSKKLLSIPRDLHTYAVVLGMTDQEVYQKVKFGKGINISNVLSFASDLSNYLRNRFDTRNEELAELRDRIERNQKLRNLHLTEAEIEMLMDLHIAVLQGRIKATDPFDITTVIMSQNGND